MVWGCGKPLEKNGRVFVVDLVLLLGMGERSSFRRTCGVRTKH